MTNIGIDLGTTHSLVAAVLSKTPRCFLDDDGRALLPSAVEYNEKGEPIMGMLSIVTCTSKLPLRFERQMASYVPSDRSFTSATTESLASPRQAAATRAPPSVHGLHILSDARSIRWHPWSS